MYDAFITTAPKYALRNFWNGMNYKEKGYGQIF